MNLFKNFFFLLQRLPQFPLPTHEVVNRGVVPKEFEVGVLVLISLLLLMFYFMTH